MSTQSFSTRCWIRSHATELELFTGKAGPETTLQVNVYLWLRKMVSICIGLWAGSCRDNLGYGDHRWLTDCITDTPWGPSMLHRFSVVMAVGKSPEAREQLCMKIKFMVLLDQQGLLVGCFLPDEHNKEFCRKQGQEKSRHCRLRKMAFWKICSLNYESMTPCLCNSGQGIQTVASVLSSTQ